MARESAAFQRQAAQAKQPKRAAGATQLPGRPVSGKPNAHVAGSVKRPSIKQPTGPRQSQDASVAVPSANQMPKAQVKRRVPA